MAAYPRGRAATAGRVRAFGRLYLSVIIAAIATGAAAAPAAGLEAITAPGSDVTLSFTRGGQVAKVLVKPGQAVEAGDAVAELDSRAEQVELTVLKAHAADKSRVEVAQAQLRQRAVDLARVKTAAKGGTIGQDEVHRAEMELRIAEVSVRLARLASEEARARLEVAEVNLGRARLRSPISGTVEQVWAHAGVAVGAFRRVVRIVNTEQLRIDVLVPLEQAEGLNVGSTAQVSFGRRGATTVQGKITFISAVADAASATRVVRVVVKNPSGRAAGERVQVAFVRSRAGGGPKESSRAPAESDRAR